MRRERETWTLTLALQATFLAVSACSGKEVAVPASASKLTITSPAFTPGSPIPEVHTCKGKDTSPSLAWSGAPATTKSFALVCDDPDAPMGTWVHWVAYAIPATVTALPEGVAPAETMASGGKQGKNSWGKLGYGGPCPPSGTHRYFFKLYALDNEPSLPPDATKEALAGAMEGHVVAAGELMGTYTKK